MGRRKGRRYWTEGMHRSVVKINTDPPHDFLLRLLFNLSFSKSQLQSSYKNQGATMQDLLIFLECFPKDKLSLSDSSSDRACRGKTEE